MRSPFPYIVGCEIVPAVKSQTTFPVLIQADQETLDALDKWISEQPEPKPSRAEAAGYLVKDSLIGMGLRRVKA